MISVKINSNSDHVNTSLTVFSRNWIPNTMQESYLAIRSNFHAVEKRLFETEGATGNDNKWKKLSPPYKRWKDRNFPSRPIMVLRGNLKKSLTTLTGDAIREFRQSGQNYLIKLGTNVTNENGVDYPSIHQFTFGPIRRTIDPKPEDSRVWAFIIQNRAIVEGRRSNAWDSVSADGAPSFVRKGRIVNG